MDFLHYGLQLKCMTIGGCRLLSNEMAVRKENMLLFLHHFASIVDFFKTTHKRGFLSVAMENFMSIHEFIGEKFRWESYILRTRYEKICLRKSDHLHLKRYASFILAIGSIFF